MKDGDLVIFDSAARYDGTSRTYAPLEFPAVADHSVLQACIRAAEALGIRHHVGCTRSPRRPVRAPSRNRKLPSTITGSPIGRNTTATWNA